MDSNQHQLYGAHKGSAQHDRWLAAASPESIPLDERGMKEWVEFARKFSSWIRFHQDSKEEWSSWAPFFENDLTAIYGRLAIQSVSAYRKQVSLRFHRIASEDKEASAAERKAAMGELFAGLASLAWALDQYANLVPRSEKLSQGIDQWIERKLSPALRRAMGFYKAARSLGWITDPTESDWIILGSPVSSFSELMARDGWSDRWYRPKVSMASLYASQPGDHRIFLGETAFLEQGRAAVQHNLFAEVFDQFLGAYAQLVAEADVQLQASLKQQAGHLPHYALFLSFLQLTRHQKEWINRLGQAHLDFYYQDVLRLKQKEAKPHRAHLLLSLAKHYHRHELEEGTLFFGGKDDEGRERWFRSLTSTWISHARLGSFCSLYMGEHEDNGSGQQHEGRWFASPVAASADGLGEALPKEENSWHPLVNKTYKDGVVSSVAMPMARLGFALRSRQLFLSEGQRRIRLRWVLRSGSAPFPLGSQWEARVSTAKGWMDLGKPSLVASTTSSENGNKPCVEFRLEIPASAPVLEGDPQHGAESLPVLELSLSHGDGSQLYDYQALQGVRVQGLELEVSAGWESNGYNQDGLKQLVLVNDVGNLDPTKPFMPFGSRPGKGASLIIGSPELFQKKGSQVRLQVEWDQLPSETADIAYGTTTPPKVDVHFLVGGQWVPGSPSYSAVSLFSNGTNKKSISGGSVIKIPQAAVNPDPIDLHSFKSNQRNGFMRLRLGSGFGYTAYQSAVRNFLIGLANGTKAETDEPKEPYLPTVRSLYISYLSRVWMDMDQPADPNEEAQLTFSHLYPFGQRGIYPSPNSSPSKGLIPAIGEPGASGFLPHQSSFFFQILDLEAGGTISILFQFQQGSADPRVSKPKNHIFWSYLSGSEWKPFPKDQVVDLTQAGIRTGLIRFTLPLDAGGPQSLMPEGGIWVRGAVQEGPLAICRIQGIHPHAIEVVEDFLDPAASDPPGILAATSITRLRSPQAAVKKVEQPYPGFGGRAPESRVDFQRRVSERLRHKDRAVTRWDYERLVLEAFPEIHRVNCLHNTRYEGTVYEENRPGHVTIIPLPDLSDRQDINPLKPYTHQDTLEEISAFLSKRISAHVQLHVRQPKFEEVRVAMKVRFLPGFPFGFYKEKLQEEICQFLSPWMGNREEASFTFGGLVDKSVLVNFIDERPYVDYITELRMYHRLDESDSLESEDQDQIQASSARSILVSAPSWKHDIKELEIEEAPQGLDSCLPSPEA